MFRSDFRENGACSKSVRKMLYPNKSLVKWMHFQTSLSLWELQVIRDLLYIEEITKQSLNRLLLLFVYQRCTVEKGVLTNFANSKGKHLCWSLFLIKLQAWGHLRIYVNDCFCIFMWFYLQCMKKIQLTRRN